VQLPTTVEAVEVEGGKLVLEEGQRNFFYWSSDYGYRNDMDLIGVRAGCTFTGFAGNGFTGSRATVRAEQWDRWVVFAREAQYQHIDENIESLTCHCIQLS